MKEERKTTLTDSQNLFRVDIDGEKASAVLRLQGGANLAELSSCDSRELADMFLRASELLHENCLGGDAVNVKELADAIAGKPAKKRP